MSDPLIPYDLGVYEPPGGFRNVFGRPGRPMVPSGVDPDSCGSYGPIGDGTFAAWLRGLSQVSGDFSGPLNEHGIAWAWRMISEAEAADRREWITGVKRRLGLVEHGEPAAQRMAQWEEDRRTQAEPAARATCNHAFPARKLCPT